jgi:hypothetical protein
MNYGISLLCYRRSGCFPLGHDRYLPEQPLDVAAAVMREHKLDTLEVQRDLHRLFYSEKWLCFAKFRAKRAEEVCLGRAAAGRRLPEYTPVSVRTPTATPAVFGSPLERDPQTVPTAPTAEENLVDYSAADTAPAHPSTITGSLRHMRKQHGIQCTLANMTISAYGFNRCRTVETNSSRRSGVTIITFRMPFFLFRATNLPNGLLLKLKGRFPRENIS